MFRGVAFVVSVVRSPLGVACSGVGADCAPDGSDGVADVSTALLSTGAIAPAPTVDATNSAAINSGRALIRQMSLPDRQKSIYRRPVV
jgi:hypothetical protein